MLNLAPRQMALFNPNLEGFFESDYRNYVLHGGRMSSKTHHAAGTAVFIASRYKIRFLCIRQFQNKIADSVYTVLCNKISEAKMDDEFAILNNSIIHKSTGSEFLFYGIARNINEIKGAEDIDITWIEEGENLTQAQWTVIEPTVRRKQGSRVWLIFNPKMATDFVWKKFVVNPPARTVVRQINYNENPFLSSDARELIASHKADDFDDYQHIYEGLPLDNDDESIIKRSHLMAAIDAHITLRINISGARKLGFDVADDGDDLCAMVETYGSLSHWADMWKGKEDELLKSCSRVWQRANQQKCRIVYDAIGVGATSGSKFNELNISNKTRVNHDKFFAGGAVMAPDAIYNHTGMKNRDYFSNIKSQSWWLVADRLRNTYNAVTNGQKFKNDEMLFIDANIPHITRLIDELSTPRRSFDGNGKVIVEQKKDLKKRDIPSPNLADAFIMANIIIPKIGSF